MARLFKATMKSRKKGSRSAMAMLKKKLERLQGEKVYAGYFAEQGEHSTAEMTYPELMMLHEFGMDVPPRPAMRLTAHDLRNKMTTTGIGNDAMSKYISGEIYLRGLLDAYGREAYEVAQNVFGSNRLPITYNPTPLVDTGELADAFSWKTTLNGRVKSMKRRKSVKFERTRRKRG